MTNTTKNWATISEANVVTLYTSRQAAREAHTGKVYKSDDTLVLQAVAETKEQAKMSPYNCEVCPECGSTELFTGRVEKGIVVDEAKQVKAHSVVASPCALVHSLADKMVGARRSEVIKAAVAAGVALGTAKTQYQKWFSSKK